MTVGIDDYLNAFGHNYPANAGDNGVLVSAFVTDADRVGLTSNTSVADIDVVTISREMAARITAHPIAVLSLPVVRWKSDAALRSND